MLFNHTGLRGPSSAGLNCPFFLGLGGGSLTALVREATNPEVVYGGEGAEGGRVTTMRLEKLKLYNFRCFGGKETEVCFNDFTALIGANSTGKTALLHALLKLFGNQEERELRRSDFYIPPDVSPDSVDELSLYIEAVLAFPELEGDNREVSKLSVPPFFNQMVVSSPGREPYVRIRLSADWVRTSSPEGDIDSRLEFLVSPEGSDTGEDTTHRVQAHQRSQIRVAYVPAVRDPSVHLRSHSSSILWRLLRAVSWPDGLRKAIEEHAAEIDAMFLGEKGVGNIQRGLQDHWSVFHDDDKYARADIQFNPTELEDILRKVQVGFRPTPDGTSYSIEQLGDGLRSLFYLSMVSTLLDIESRAVGGDDLGISREAVAPPALTILALEEPENHLSPHLLGRVVEHCYELSSQAGCQVVITSHTPALLKRVDPEDIRHLRLDADTKSTIVSGIKLPPKDDEAHKYVREAVRAYPEMYFSKVVVLGEGASEEIVLSRSIEASGLGLDRSQISVVPLGGRHVNHFWKLLGELKIPHVTLLDLDRERPGGGWRRVQYAIKQLLEVGVPRDDLYRLRLF